MVFIARWSLYLEYWTINRNSDMVFDVITIQTKDLSRTTKHYKSKLVRGLTVTKTMKTDDRKLVTGHLKSAVQRHMHVTNLQM